MSGPLLLLVVGLPLLVAGHELGHALAASWCGLEWRPRLTWLGPGVAVLAPGGSWADRSLAPESAYAPADLLLFSLAGPVASLVLGVVLVAVGVDVLGLASLELAAFNLWPRGRSDGGRAWRSYRRLR